MIRALPKYTGLLVCSVAAAMLVSACSGAGVSTVPTSTPSIDMSLMLGELPPVEYDESIRGVLPVAGSVWEGSGKVGGTDFEGAFLFKEGDQCFQAASYRLSNKADAKEIQVVDEEVLQDSRVEKLVEGDALQAVGGWEEFVSSSVLAGMENRVEGWEDNYAVGACSLVLLPYIAEISEETVKGDRLETILTVDQERYELFFAQLDRAWLKGTLEEQGVPSGEIPDRIYQYEKKRPPFWVDGMENTTFTITTNGLDWKMAEKQGNETTMTVYLLPDESLIIKQADPEKIS